MYLKRVTILTALLVNAVAEAVYVSKNVPLVSDFVLDLHACVSLQLGLDHIEQLVTAMFKQQIEQCKDCDVHLTSETLTIDAQENKINYHANTNKGDLLFTLEVDETEISRVNETYKVP